MSRTEIAWAAGFLDGEGSIVISLRPGRRSVGHQLHIQAGQAVRDPLDRLASILGGKVYEVKTRGTFSWSMNCTGDGAALKKIRPYVNVKTVEIDLALEFLETYKDRGRTTRAVPAELIEERERLRIAMIKHRNAKYALSRKVGGAAWRKWQRTKHKKRSL